MAQLNFKNWLVESFDSISEFLLNPEHKAKTWEQLMDEFESSGGEQIGNGQYGRAFSHPSWPYILKMYTDPLYTSFVRFAFKNPHSAFPKFFGPPQRVAPFYKRWKGQATTYLVRMERLEPIDAATWKLIQDNNNMVQPYMHAKETGTLGQTVPGWLSSEERRTYRQAKRQARDTGQPEPSPPVAKQVNPFQQFTDALKQNPNLLPLFEGMVILLKSGLKGAPDFKQANFMKRKNGSLVYTDPYWEGTNPYTDAQAAHDMETDRYGHEDLKWLDVDPDLVGGEMPRKKRSWKNKKKKKKATYHYQGKDHEDPPF